MTEMITKFEALMMRPPVNIEGIIRLFGIELDKSADLHPKILGEIRKTDGSYKIAVNKTDHYYRKRFTMAHELAHFLLHRDKLGEGVDDNVAYRSTPDGNFYNQLITAKEETEANQLAASLLMPERLLKESLSGRSATEESVIRELSNSFQVSPAAMKIRLSVLNGCRAES